MADIDMCHKIKWKRLYRELRIMRSICDEDLQCKLIELGMNEMPDSRRPHIIEIQTIQDKLNIFRESKRRPIVLIDGRMWLPAWDDIWSGNFIRPVRPQ